MPKRHPRKNVRKPQQQRKKRQPARKQKKDYTKSWLTVTFHKGFVPDTFFPSNIFPEAIHSDRITFEEAKRKKVEFWKDKNVIFHMADRSVNEYKSYYKKVLLNARICFLKFACGTGATDMTHYDRNPGRPLFSHYRMMSDLCPNFLWEMPMDYNMFWGHTNKVPLTLYDKKYESPINNNKKIDFLLMMDNRMYYNYTKTLELGKKLKEQGYNVHAILVKSNIAKMYHNKLPYKDTLNTKTPEGQKTFHKLALNSKIMIDLCFRWTYVRVIYEALFNNCACIGPHCYGAMYQLFPDMIIDTSNYNMKDAFDFCLDKIEKWNIDMVKQYQIRARKVASPKVFSQRLNEATEIILNGGKYEFKGY